MTLSPRKLREWEVYVETFHSCVSPAAAAVVVPERAFRSSVCSETRGNLAKIYANSTLWNTCSAHGKENKEENLFAVKNSK